MTDRLQVTKDTTLSQLQSFMLQAGAGKVRGKETKDGYVLYVDTKSSSMLDRMKGTARKRNEAAASGVQMVLKKYVDNGSPAGVTAKSKGGQELFKAINERTKIVDGHALRQADVAGLVRDIHQTGKKLGFRPGYMPSLPTMPKLPDPPTKEQLAARGPSVQMKLSTAHGNELFLMLQGAGTPQGRQTAIDRIAQRIDTNIGALNLPHEKLDALAMSSGTSVKQQLKDAITTEYQRQGLPVPTDLDDMVNAGFEKYANQKLGSHQVGGFQPTTIDRDGKQQSVDLPVIHIKGGDYKATRFLGEGGFGNVYLYENTSPPHDTVAFKLFNPPRSNDSGDVDQVNGANIQEVQVQKRASSGGSDNILNVEGVVRLGNGMIGIALETAPHGNLFDAALTGMPSLTGTGLGQVSVDEAKVIKLTALKGALQGLRDMQAQNIMHMDLKSPNMMLGQDGKVKVIDFGTGSVTNSIKFTDLPKVDNPIYKSPEALQAEALQTDAVKKEKERIETELKGIAERLYPITDSMTDDQKSEIENKRNKYQGMLSSDVTQPFAQQLWDNDPTMMSQKHDNWGVGMLGLELFAGRQIFPDVTFMSELAEKIVEWSKDPTARAVSSSSTPPLPGNCLMLSTGDPLVDDLINKMLDPDPTKRLTVAQALSHPAFGITGVGDPVVEKFTPKLLKGGEHYQALNQANKDIADGLRAVDNRLLKALGPTLTPQMTQKLQDGTLTTAERAQLLGQIPVADRGPYDRDMNKVQAATTERTNAQQRINTFEQSIAQDKAGFQAVL